MLLLLEAIGQLRHLDTMENLGFDEPDYFPSDDDEAGREGRVEMASALAEMGVPPDDEWCPRCSPCHW